MPGPPARRPNGQSMRGLLNRRLLRFATFFVLGAGVTLLAGLQTGFHVIENDFWSVLYYGRHLVLSEPASLYNGFYPIGYAFLLGRMPLEHVVELSYALNALLAGLFVAAVTDLVSARGSVIATLLALAFSLSSRPVFHYANTVGPDIGAAAFTALAVDLLWYDRLRGAPAGAPMLQSLLVGASLGLAMLWRTHAGVSSLLILAAAFLLGGRRKEAWGWVAISSFVALVSLQLAANVLSGHGVFETAQKFNIYKLFFPVNWIHPPTPEEIAGFSVLDVVASEPQRFLDTYVPYFTSLASLAWPGLLCFLVAPARSEEERFGLFAAVSAFLYAIPLALGDSPRAPLTVMALFIAPLFVGAAVLMSRLSQTAAQRRLLRPALWALLAAGSLIPVLGWVRTDLALLRQNAAQHRNFLAIQEELLKHDLTSADQLFSDKYQVYLPSVLPYVPRQVGGWGMDWLWGYSAEYPEIPMSSWDAFARASRQQGVRYLVLSPGSDYLLPEFALIYDRAYDEDVLGLEFIGVRAKMRMYRFTDPAGPVAADA